METLTSTESIIIEAPAEKVWEVLVKPQYIKQWFEQLAKFDDVPELQPGNKIEWIDDNGQVYAKGTIREIEPLKMIKTSAYFCNWNISETTTDLTDSYILEEINGRILLKHSYGNFEHVPNGKELYKEYLNSITPANKELQKIKELAER